MGGPATVVEFRGFQFDQQTVDMILEAERLIGARLRVSQGSYSHSKKSAGTHAGGGAVDFMGLYDIDTVRQLRIVGMFASQRTPAEGDWPYHVHAVAVDNPRLSDAAKRQVEAYRRGRNGLSNNGPDTGPKVPIVNWFQYLANKKSEETNTPKREISTMDAVMYYGSTRGRAICGDRLIGITRHMVKVAIEAGVTFLEYSNAEVEVLESQLIFEGDVE